MKVTWTVFELQSGHKPYRKIYYFQFLRAITPKIHNPELQFLRSARRLMLLYICVKFHENISNGFWVTERTWFCDRQTDDNMSPNPTGGNIITFPQLSSASIKKGYLKYNHWHPNKWVKLIIYIIKPRSHSPKHENLWSRVVRWDFCSDCAFQNGGIHSGHFKNMEIHVSSKLLILFSCKFLQKL